MAPEDIWMRKWAFWIYRATGRAQLCSSKKGSHSRRTIFISPVLEIVKLFAVYSTLRCSMYFQSDRKAESWTCHEEQTPSALAPKNDERLFETSALAIEASFEEFAKTNSFWTKFYTTNDRKQSVGESINLRKNFWRKTDTSKKSSCPGAGKIHYSSRKISLWCCDVENGLVDVGAFFVIESVLNPNRKNFQRVETQNSGTPAVPHPILSREKFLTHTRRMHNPGAASWLVNATERRSRNFQPNQAIIAIRMRPLNERLRKIHLLWSTIFSFKLTRKSLLAREKSKKKKLKKKFLKICLKIFFVAQAEKQFFSNKSWKVIFQEKIALLKHFFRRNSEGGPALLHHHSQSALKTTALRVSRGVKHGMVGRGCCPYSQKFLACLYTTFLVKKYFACLATIVWGEKFWECPQAIFWFNSKSKPLWHSSQFLWLSTNIGNMKCLSGPTLASSSRSRIAQ